MSVVRPETSVTEFVRTHNHNPVISYLVRAGAPPVFSFSCGSEQVSRMSRASRVMRESPALTDLFQDRYD